MYNYKNLQWTLWIGTTVWNAFKSRKEVYHRAGLTLTNTQLIRLLLELKNDLNLPYSEQFEFKAYQHRQTEEDARTILPEDKNTVTGDENTAIEDYPQSMKRVLSPKMLGSLDEKSGKRRRTLTPSNDSTDTLAESKSKLPYWLSVIMN